MGQYQVADFRLEGPNATDSTSLVPSPSRHKCAEAS